MNDFIPPGFLAEAKFRAHTRLAFFSYMSVCTASKVVQCQTSVVGVFVVASAGSVGVAGASLSGVVSGGVRIKFVQLL